MKRDIELGPQLRCDLDRLITTRLLIQANSGGGKSWALRRLLEQSHGHVQQLVLDPEGEFATLRERYDYVLAARSGGDTVADPRLAAELATRLLKLEVSAVLDLYELKPLERKAFVRLFLEAIIEAPRSLWHPVLIVLDEAHVYCPEKDEAESSNAVIDIATRGRKRGFCLVAATQRLAKFDKDAAAELNNKLIGRTVLDDDMKRAGDELGFRTQEQRLSLRELGATTATEGEWFAFGPAFSVRGVVRGRTGPVLTTHPKAGQRSRALNPPPSTRIKALLPQLADLPKEAEERQQTMEGLRRQLTETRRELTTLRHAQPKPPPVPKVEIKRVEVGLVKDAQIARMEQALTRMEKIRGESLGKLVQAIAALEESSRPIREALAKRPWQAPPPIMDQLREAARRGVMMTDSFRKVIPVKTVADVRAAAARQTARQTALQDGEQDGKLSSSQQRIVDAAALLESLGFRAPDPVRLALFAGQSATGGYWRQNIGRCRSLGLIEGTALTDAGRARARPSAIQTTEDLQRHVFENLLSGAQRPILKVLVDVYPEALTPARLGQLANLEPEGGYWRQNIGRLRSLGLVTKKGPLAALPVLFADPA